MVNPRPFLISCTHQTGVFGGGKAMAARRDPWLDNSKMALVALVAVGHSWTLLPKTIEISWAYDWLYAWHIPAFVAITGYLSRSFTWAPSRLRQLAQTIVVPYVIFELAYAWMRATFGGVTFEKLLLNPHWPMWYLAAFVIWRLLTPIFMRPPAAVAIGASVLISLSAGFWAGEIFDLSRAMGLLPFFVIGLRVSPAALSWLKTASFRWAAVVGFLVIFTAARFTDQWTVTEVLYYRSSYAQLGGGGLHEMIVRALTLSLGLLGTACFFKLVPSIGGWFAKLGQATLEVYLFHGFFILTAEYAGFPDWAAGHPGLAWLIATVGAVVLALTLAQPPVARVLNVAVDPIGNALKLRRPTKEAKVQGTNGH